MKVLHKPRKAYALSLEVPDESENGSPVPFG